MLISGCAAVTSVPPKAKGLQLKNFCEQNNIQYNWDSIAQVVTLKRNELTAHILLDSEIVLVDNELVALSGAVTLEGSIIYVPADFNNKVISRFVESVGFLINKFNTIIIDAGHGGKDPGAIGKTGLVEKQVVLDIAGRLKTILENSGIKVVMTRENDVFIPLEERTKIASQSRVDLFVSIHANANPSKKVHGLEVYHLRSLESKEKEEPQRLENEKTIFKNLFMAQDAPFVEGILADLLFTHKQYESESLAASLAQGTSRFIETPNRGSKTAGFYVLRNTWIPAVLVEVGFLSNAQEEQLLYTSEYRQKIAEGIAQSIIQYASR